MAGIGSPASPFPGTPLPLRGVLTHPVRTPRAYLPLQPSTQHITNVYHTSDPIQVGTCTGFGSSCNAAGVALETRCHLGQTVTYDTITQLGPSVNVMHHGIAGVVDVVLAMRDIDWAGNGINGRPVPAPETDCMVSNCMYGYVALLEALMVPCTRIAVTGRLVT